MPSLYKSAPTVPIVAAKVHADICRLLERQYKGDLPPWWNSLRPTLTVLLNVGFAVSGRPSAEMVWAKLQSVAEASKHISTIEHHINNNLSRGSQSLALEQCATAHLTYFLGMVDEWLRACEQYAQESSRFASDFGDFQALHKQLEDAAAQHVPRDLAKYWNLVHMFATLEKAETSRSLGITTPASSDNNEPGEYSLA